MTPSIRRGAPLAALVLLVLALVWWLARDGVDSPSLDSPTPAASAAPRTLADLPRGAPADVIYVVGKTLVMGEREVVLTSRPMNVHSTADAVVAQFRDGSMVRVDRSSQRVESFSETGSGPPVVDPGGNFVAWQAVGPGTAEVVVFSLIERVPRFVDRQSFPAIPSCCDNPFQVVGMSQLGDVYVTLPATNQAWVWNIYEGREGVPHDVASSEEFVLRIDGLAGGQLSQITASEIVVAHHPTTKSKPMVLGIGGASDGTYQETQRVEAVSADFRDPRARRIVFWTGDGIGHISPRASGPGVAGRGTDAQEEITLGLPTSVVVDPVYWEDDDHFVLDARDPSLKTRGLVRCDARSGECETAGPLEANALIAFPQST